MKSENEDHQLEIEKFESEIRVAETQLTTCNAQLKESEALVNSLKPAKEAVLLLSTYKYSNVPMVIDFEGRKLTINK